VIIVTYESVAVAGRRVVLVFIVGRIVIVVAVTGRSAAVIIAPIVGRIIIVVAVTGRSAAVIIAPIIVESEIETTLNAFVVTVLELAVGAVIFGSVEYGTWG
jgi:hypothetical protein